MSCSGTRTRSWSTRPTAPDRCARPGSPRPRGRRSATNGATTRCSARSRSTPSPGRCSPASPPSRATSPGCVRSTRPARGCSARRCRPSSRSPATSSTRRCATGRVVVDTRTAEAHALQRIPGSLSIPAGPSFGTWLGWVVDADRPIVLLVDDEADLDDLARQAVRIGFETIVGPCRRRAARLARIRPGGPGRDRASTSTAWRASWRPAARMRPSSSTSGRRPSSRPATCPVRCTSAPASCRPCSTELPRDRPIATICASGYRSSVAASMLRAAGFEHVGAVGGGRPGLGGARLPGRRTAAPTAARAGRPVPTGEGHAH